MIHPILEARLRPALRRRRRLALTLRLAVWLAIAAVAGIALRSLAGHPEFFPVWLITSGAGALGVALWSHRRSGNAAALARRIEARHPELQGRLLTAVEIRTDAETPLTWPEERLLEETMLHSVEKEWTATVSRPVQAGADVLLAAALMLLLFTGAVLWSTPRVAADSPQTTADLPPMELSDDGVAVLPGDVELEKGTSLTVMARFTKDLPAAADLVIGEMAASETRLPLVRSLNDPVFGGGVPEVTKPFLYRVEHDGKRTRDFTVKVFEYPKLERSDITVTPPAYTGLPARRTEDTRRAGGVEGSVMDLDLQLNKPVASAELRPKAPEGKVIPLSVDAKNAVATLRGHVLAESGVYELALKDADGRGNKQRAEFHFEVRPNTPPEIRLTSPRGDTAPSPLEEMIYDGTAFDDFGVTAFGLTIARPGAEPISVELGRGVPAGEKRPFQHPLRLEELGVKPDDLVTWNVWAEDIGPDGKPRRTEGDLFFAAIRPFEEIFREGESMAGGAAAGGQQQQGQGPAAKLEELQKQIINATWKLIREAGKEPRKDAEVVRDSQIEALNQAREAAEESKDGGWPKTVVEMEKAVQELERAAAGEPELRPALAAEQRAYQNLLGLREREIQVSRSQSQSASASGGAQEQRRQELDELELTQAENRYETERAAGAQTPEEAARKEQSQVLNRLQELARRQEQANERLKELRAALEEAKTEEERETLRRELKRLQDDQRELLADMDEVKERMERPENQSAMAEDRKALEKAREEARAAAEAAESGNVPQAVASGTRAQRQLQEMRDEIRKRNSAGFSEELRELRAEARRLAGQQEELTKDLRGAAPKDAPPSLAGPAEDGEETARLEKQRERAANLLKRATDLSEQTESAEPLVSRGLYDSVRDFSQNDAGGVKKIQDEMMRDGTLTQKLYSDLSELQKAEDGGKTLQAAAELLRGEMPEKAADAGELALNDIGNLRKGLERAAENVLGDDSEALRRADKELEDLANQLESEMNDAAPGGQQPGQGEQAGQGQQSGQGEQSGQGQQPGQGKQSGEGQQPGQGEQSGQGQQPGQGEQPGEGQQPGQSEQSGQGQQPGQGEQSGQAQQPGQGEQSGQGQQPGQGEQSGQGQQSGQGEQSGQGQQPGQGEQSGQGQQPGQGGQSGQGQQPGQGGQSGQGRQPGQQADGGGEGGGETRTADRNGGGGTTRGGASQDSTGGRGGRTAAPLSGDGYAPWSDRLREVEEMVEFPDLRDSLANARERARRVRQESKRDLKKPDWAQVRLEVLKPLVEVRKRVREELARRESDDALVPIDRDPVPGRYTDLVRRYYEELGREP